MSDHASNLDPVMLEKLARRRDLVGRVRDFYADVDREVASRGPTCWNRGACCRFGEYGHRLYVTTLELVYYLAQGGFDEIAPAESGTRPESDRALPVLSTIQEETMAADTCPHAHDGICHARDRRPMSCRLFFCDPDARDWQNPLSEALLARLRAMHDEMSVPYVYVDWMAALRALKDTSSEKRP